MRLVAWMLATITLCLGLTGCALFDKNKSSNGSNGGSGTARNSDKGNDPLYGKPSAQAFPSAPASQKFASNTRPGSTLAGRVINPARSSDDMGQGNAYVRWACVEDKDNATPKDLAVNPDGYFVIAGVKPGAHYKLIARAKNGERMVAGMTYATAPDIHVLIQMKEEFANAETPPVPGGPGVLDKQPAPPPDKSEKTSSAGSDFPPTMGAITVPTTSRATQEEPQDLPVSVAIPIRNSSPPNSGWTPGNPPSSNWTPGAGNVGLAPPPNYQPPPKLRKDDILGPLDIKGPPNRPSDEFKLPPTPPVPPLTPGGPSPDEPPPPRFPTPPPITDPGPSAQLSEPAQVPQCRFENNRLVNFALYETNGVPWEFRKHRGKLVLLDFWGTWCPPCRESIPRLCELQNRYADKGLEIIGIAYEQDGDQEQQAHRVNSMSQKLHASYRQLLCSGSNCPVVNQFKVKGFPTLVLLDENGTIIWRHRGLVDRSAQQEVENIIQRRLN